MQNRKKQDSISVNKITRTTIGDVTNSSNKPVGNAAEDPFCVFANKRHAVGSKIINQDGSEAVCKEDGSWKNT